MTDQRRAAWLFLALAAMAAAFRFPQLAARPMHADEAVNADKLGTLLEQGRYEYSTVDYHGPTLYYVALAAARARGITRYVDLNEAVLRAVTAAIGVLLVAAHFWLIPYLGLPAAALAALFTAVSPAMVYYSRYFIHETLLVFLTFCALLAVLAYLRRPSAEWALGAGALFGLMFATKETWIIAAGCMAVAGLDKLKHVLPRHLIFATIAFLAIAVLANPRGIVDSVLAYRTYFARGAGVNTVHVHPWYFYFQCLRAEVLIALLALVGLFASNAPRFLKIYTVLMVAIYCAIPYKAPWNVLSFWQASILLAGAGTVWLAQRIPKLLVIALVGIGVAQLGWQARADSFRYASDPRNPWVYAHTGTDVFLIVKQVDALAAVHPLGRAMPIQIFTHENLWPLPWYFRRYSGVRWWNGVSDTAPLAPVILATPDMEPALLHRIYEVPPPGQREMYVNMFDRYVELRPSVEVRGYVAKSLWDDLR
jgi:4-amino-4-deoxy-L-arabinose transferase-like glycosyltransferase